MARPNLFEFAGGDDAFLALAAAVTERCIADPEPCRLDRSAGPAWPMPRWSWDGLVTAPA